MRQKKRGASLAPLEAGVLLSKVELDSPIPASTLFGVIGSNWLGFAKALGDDVVGVDTMVDKIFLDRFGSFEPELHVVFLGAHAVGVPMELDLDIRVGFENLDCPVKHRIWCRDDIVLVELEVDAFKLRQVRLLRTSELVNLHALGRIGALIDAVEDAITIRVHGATLLVNPGTFRCVRTLVDAVIDTITVGILWTSALVNDGTFWCIGTSVESVTHPITV